MPRLEEWLPMTGNGQDRTRLTDPLAIFCECVRAVDWARRVRRFGSRRSAQIEASTSFDGTE